MIGNYGHAVAVDELKKLFWTTVHALEHDVEEQVHQFWPRDLA